MTHHDRKETPPAAKGEKLRLSAYADYAAGSIVSKELLRASAGTITCFAFDAGQGLSEHSAPFDAFVQVLDGRGKIVIGGVPHALGPGEAIVMPKDVPHAVQAEERFKMLLVMIKK